MGQVVKFSGKESAHDSLRSTRVGHAEAKHCAADVNRAANARPGGKGAVAMVALWDLAEDESSH